MPFQPEIKDYINNYIKGHLPNDVKTEIVFSYIKDEPIRKRIITEYTNTRYIYKFFEGMQATDDLLISQVRLQIIMYANVYEAVIHYILFTLYKDTEAVNEIMYVNALKEISIPSDKLTLLAKSLIHDKKNIITCYRDAQKRDITKIRFDEKADAAFKLGLIDEELKEELINFYNIRNAIHLHAELRKGIEYELDMSKLAYWRIEKFNQLIQNKLTEDKKI